MAACRVGVPMRKLSESEIAAHLARVPGWSRAGDAIRREYRMPDFASVMRLVNRVGDLAEEADHHPDVDIRFRRVVFTLTTHDAGGLTERDFELAARIDARSAAG